MAVSASCPREEWETRSMSICLKSRYSNEETMTQDKKWPCDEQKIETKKTVKDHDGRNVSLPHAKKSFPKVSVKYAV